MHGCQVLSTRLYPPAFMKSRKGIKLQSSMSIKNCYRANVFCKRERLKIINVHLRQCIAFWFCLFLGLLFRSVELSTAALCGWKELDLLNVTP